MERLKYDELSDPRSGTGIAGVPSGQRISSVARARSAAVMSTGRGTKESCCAVDLDSGDIHSHARNDATARFRAHDPVSATAEGGDEDDTVAVE